MAISFHVIVDMVLKAFADEAIKLYFGQTFIILLQQSLIKPNNNFADVKPESWSCKSLNEIDLLTLLIET